MRNSSNVPCPIPRHFDSGCETYSNFNLYHNLDCFNQRGWEHAPSSQQCGQMWACATSGQVWGDMARIGARSLEYFVVRGQLLAIFDARSIQIWAYLYNKSASLPATVWQWIGLWLKASPITIYYLPEYSFLATAAICWIIQSQVSDFENLEIYLKLHLRVKLSNTIIWDYCLCSGRWVDGT
jgi:hypothetical protein